MISAMQTLSKVSRNENMTPQLTDFPISTAKQGSTNVVSAPTLNQKLFLPPIIHGGSRLPAHAPKEFTSRNVANKIKKQSV